MLSHYKTYLVLLALLITAGILTVVGTAQAQCSPMDLICMSMP